MTVVALAALLLPALSGCSTTSRLADDEVLYTGVKHITYNAPEGEEIISSVKDQVFSTINVKPNNSLYSPYIRHPFPVGLWVYNHWDNTATKGFKHWIYEKLAADPVLISDVRPALRVEMIKSTLENNGYFGSSATYELQYDKRNPKKARVNYTINLTTPRKLGRVMLTGGSSPVEQYIDSLARRSRYLRVGSRYCTDSLDALRINITNRLRNRGYYFFRPEYIEYLADSVMIPDSVVVKMTLSDNIPQAAKVKYYIGDVEAVVKDFHGQGVPDTLETRSGRVIRYLPINLKPQLVPSCLTLRKGRTFSVRTIEQTQDNLSRMGIFSSVTINTTPIDSVKSDSLDVKIECVLDMPLEAKFEIQAASKSNSYIGPAAVFGLTHKNVFGGGEQLTSQINGSYEWMTGNSSGSRLNSYEVGLDFTLAFPRLIAPRFIDRSRRYINWTKVNLSADLLNRPSFFKMVQLSTGFVWEWHANRFSSSSFTPFKLSYTKLLSHTVAFDSIISQNRAVENSFSDQFIPMMSYTYTFDRKLSRRNSINFTFTVSEAGNIFSGIWALAGQHGGAGTKELFGTPFSQFVKAQAQLIYTRSMRSGQSIVTRAFIGAEHAYGNSAEVPYAEQFYIGGANSVRAFAVRSIGPGSYHSDGSANGYYDQTGTFKIELNAEYRFPILGFLHGALFVDMGNVWLLQEDPLRPGSQLTAQNFLKDVALGTGLGLRFDMDVLVLRADLGIGIHAPYETGRSGYYNMTSFKDSLAFHLAIGYPF